MSDRRHAGCRLGLLLAALLPSAPVLHAQTAAIVPAWLYPVAIPSANPTATDSSAPLRLPRSTRTFTPAQLADRFAVPDWYPASHPAMPPIVAVGRKPDVAACGYCHLPAGQGRPENAALAGLPAEYIARQMAELRSGARRNALAAPYRPWDNMHRVAVAATDEEVRIAAAYFSTLPLPRRVRVVETGRVPRTYVAGFLRAVSPEGGDEPIDGRIVEVAEDHERFERRDERTRYIAYVPPGSLARGGALVRGAVAGTAACASCHGPSLRGGPIAPPIAGRSPSYLLRQLVAFHTGARAGSASGPMRAMTATYTLDDMVALAAYVGALDPQRSPSSARTFSCSGKNDDPRCRAHQPRSSLHLKISSSSRSATPRSAR